MKPIHATLIGNNKVHKYFLSTYSVFKSTYLGLKNSAMWIVEDGCKTSLANFTFGKATINKRQLFMF